MRPQRGPGGGSGRGCEDWHRNLGAALDDSSSAARFIIRNVSTLRRFFFHYLPWGRLTIRLHPHSGHDGALIVGEVAAARVRPLIKVVE